MSATADVAAAAPEVSVVVPVFGNRETLWELSERIRGALVATGRSHEVIFVDDGCRGGSWEILCALASADDRIKLLRHPSNLGQHTAVLTGLAQARGAKVVVLDADLQDPPEAIPDLLRVCDRDTPIVFAARAGRYESAIRLLTGRAYRGVLRRITPLPAGAGMFVALDREAVRRVLLMQAATPGRSPAVVAMLGLSGLSARSFPVARSRHPGGGSAYGACGRAAAAWRSLSWVVAWRLGDTKIEREPANLRHNADQRRYFERAPKRTMIPRPSRYLSRHIDELLSAAEIVPTDRVLEVGCGMGRYTLRLAERGIAIEGLDLSPVLLAQLAGYAGGTRPIPLHCADALDPPAELHGSFDVVVALFTLHHMYDPAAAMASMARLLRPGGRAAFVEPNPLNPLYYAQIAARPGMSWVGDGGIIKIRRRPMIGGLARAGFTDLYWRRFGFFPPGLTEGPLRGLERPLEGFGPWRSLLPFQIFGGRLASPGGAEPAHRSGVDELGRLPGEAGGHGGELVG